MPDTRSGQRLEVAALGLDGQSSDQLPDIETQRTSDAAKGVRRGVAIAVLELGDCGCGEFSFGSESLS
jgi:hypothetical protein